MLADYRNPASGITEDSFQSKQFMPIRGFTDQRSRLGLKRLRFFARKAWSSASYRARYLFMSRVCPVLAGLWLRHHPSPYFKTTELRSLEEYMHFSSTHDPVTATRGELRDPATGKYGTSFWTSGFCFVCRRWTYFLTSWQWSIVKDGIPYPCWRENAVCPGCKLNARMRASVHLASILPGFDRNKRLYVMEQTTPLFSFLRDRFDHVVGSEFLTAADQQAAVATEAVRHEDATCLSFSDAQFDAAASFEVFEHVPDYRRAFRECARVLRPGGQLLFTVPFGSSTQVTLVRARIKDGGEIEHLLPPEIHGDPLSPEGCLAFQSFGWDILEQLEASGFTDAAVLTYNAPEFGYYGENFHILARR